jgi:hypothetical protein
MKVQALQVITDQVAKIQGLHLRDGEDARYFIMSTNQLKRIQDMAIIEKAKETSELLDRMITKRSGTGFLVERMRRNWPQSGQRGNSSRRSTDEQ